MELSHPLPQLFQVLDLANYVLARLVAYRAAGGEQAGAVQFGQFLQRGYDGVDVVVGSQRPVASPLM